MSGINAVYSADRKFTGNDVIEWTSSAEVQEQPRGEAGAGVAMADQWGEIKIETNMGPVRIAIPLETLLKVGNPSVYVVAGHTRYAREENPSIINTQPIKIETERYATAVAADSKLVGWNEINTWFEYNPKRTMTGAEVFGRVFLDELERTNGNIRDAGEKFFYRMDGKGFYSVVMLVKEKDKNDVRLVAIRDPYSGLPFCCAKRDETYFFSSGTYPMEHEGINLRDIKEVPRASVTVISENGIDTNVYEQYKKPIRTCVFERVYFGSPYDRVLTELGPKFYELYDKYHKLLTANPEFKETPSNYMIRAVLGACWAERHRELANEVDKAIPIVYTGTGVTHGISRVLGLPEEHDALFKTYAPRTFQISDKELRKMEVDLKNAGFAEFIKSFRILTGDDSIVKGGVGGYYSKKRGVLGLFERLGATSLLMAISYSPMPYPCIRGFAPYHLRERMAAEGMAHLPEETQEKLVGEKMGTGLKIPFSVGYQRKQDTYDIFGPHHCFACMDGNYPVDVKYVPDWIRSQKDIADTLANIRWV
ncbi:MAG: hypothetical protein V1900_00435 [Candidatus Aenigmatarchaeota archaeon]